MAYLSRSSAQLLPAVSFTTSSGKFFVMTTRLRGQMAACGGGFARHNLAQAKRVNNISANLDKCLDFV
jgi:hypothetical protein